MIVPFAPGGGSDIVGRILAQGLNQMWGQAVVVDNRPGAGSTVGTALAARAPADGHTIMVSSSAIAFSPSLYKQLGYEITRDFSSISLLARQPSILATAANVSARSVKELIELARSQPGKLSFGSAGIGSATHLGGELFRFSAKVEMTHVPYKSAGLAMTALLAGEIQVLLTNTATVVPHLNGGRVRALATSARTRSRVTPELPTVSESGLPGFEYDTWYALLAPAGVRHDIAARLHGDTAKVLADSKHAERLVSQGLEIVASTPQALADYLKAEITKWSRVIRAAGIAPQ
jgi:tripartite-type tricarboxylate transporter receptor subunit TctC